MLFVVLFILLFTGIISWLWVRGIDFMKENHPNYKGEDFLDWNNDITKTAGRDGWDDNTIHTEQEF